MYLLSQYWNKYSLPNDRKSYLEVIALLNIAIAIVVALYAPKVDSNKTSLRL